MITVVIPALNEEAALAPTLRRLAVAGIDEVLVVDGGSQDRTCDVARRGGARVLASKPGRGVQEAMGAREAQGEVILFLHADTLVPAGFVEEISRILNRPHVAAGAFRLQIDSPGLLVRLIESTANLRSRLLESPYGDQGIFVRRTTLESVGGVPEIPLLEDVSLIKKLRRVGRVETSPLAVKTSGRCWSGHGALRTTAANWSTSAGFVLGVDPVRLAAWRRRLLPPTAAHTP